MKPTNNVFSGGFRSGGGPAFGVFLAASLALASAARSAEVTLNTIDLVGTSSFELAGGWSNAAAPSAANDYVVSIQRLRTPADGVTRTFAGNSLKITTATGNLTFKGIGSPVITIGNLILDGGLMDHLQGTADVFNLAGNLSVTGTGSRISATQGPIIISSVISGTGELTIINNLVTTFSGANTFTGLLTINGAFTLADTGSLAFKIGASGVNNTVTGTGPATFNGAFNIDLTTAGTTIGNSWTLVNVGTVVETFGAAFNIPGFSEVNNVWTSADGKYQFIESTGVLSRINPDTDGDGLPDAWEIQYFGDLFQDAEGLYGDYDGDFSTNLLEYQSGTDPVESDSYPDSDGDQLNDGWELFYFTNLAQTKDGDPDGDYNTNYEEFVASRSPISDSSYPDTDGDEMNDGWERNFFPDLFGTGGIAAVLPTTDADGDLFDNVTEFGAKTNPTVQTSSPDTDVDSLADGWEVKYFRVGTEDLAAAIAHQAAAGDPDGDILSNFLEMKAGTDPTNAASGNPTVGYWRFEEMLTGEVPAGGNGAYAFPTSITDSSPYGNPMMSWADYSRPNYDPVIPAATVPATGAANTASLYFLRNGNDPRYFIESIFTTPANLLPAGQGFLRTFTPPQYTVEASFNTPLTGAWQVPVCKIGNPIGGQPPFSLKIDTTNKLRAGMVDGSGVAREIIGTTTIATGTWYSSAVTVTATELKLWLKGPTETSYHLEGQLAISGAWYIPSAGPLDTIWNIGGGQWNGTAADGFQGNIDEVRISATALAPEKFLFYTVGSPYTTWAGTNIPDSTKRGEADDADADGTSNLTEYRLGLLPMSGSSRFAATRAANGLLSWPSATGVTFTIQRSTTLAADSWTTVGTVPGAAGTASFTDPSPPAGKAFYKVLLQP